MKEQDPKGFSEKLESLLLQKPFDELTASEEEYVLKQFSQKEYEGYRHILINSKLAMQEDLPLDSNIHRALKTKLANTFPPKRESKLVTMARYPLPLWKVATAAAAVFLMFWAFPNIYQSQSEADLVHVYHTDTIFKEVPMLVSNTVQDSQQQIAATTKKVIPSKPRKAINRSPRKITKVVPMDTTPVVQIAPMTETPPMGQFDDQLASLDTSELENVINDLLPKTARGRSVAVDKDLMKFITEVY